MRLSILFIFSLLFQSIIGYTQSVIIGRQVWAARNLDVANFRNGDPIPQVKSEREWEKAFKKGQPAWCYYDNDSENGGRYGKIYNWHAVADPRGLVPKGWHIPNDDEWTALSNYLGDAKGIGIKMKTNFGWDRNGNGNNESGFSGLPGGYRTLIGSSNGPFYNKGVAGYWWSSTEDYIDHAWIRTLDANNSIFYRSSSWKSDAYYVRCIKD